MSEATSQRIVRVGVGILVVRQGKLLLGRRLGSHGAGTWSLPGGKLEYGESIEECARRELKEETGLDLGAVELGPYTNDVFSDVQEHYVTLFVLARNCQGEPVNLEPHKCEGWSWFSWYALPGRNRTSSLLCSDPDSSLPGRSAEPSRALHAVEGHRGAASTAGVSAIAAAVMLDTTWRVLLPCPAANR